MENEKMRMRRTRCIFNSIAEEAIFVCSFDDTLVSKDESLRLQFYSFPWVEKTL